MRQLRPAFIIVMISVMAFPALAARKKSFECRHLLKADGEVVRPERLGQVLEDFFKIRIGAEPIYLKWSGRFQYSETTGQVGSSEQELLASAAAENASVLARVYAQKDQHGSTSYAIDLVSENAMSMFRHRFSSAQAYADSSRQLRVTYQPERRSLNLTLIEPQRIEKLNFIADSRGKMFWIQSDITDYSSIKNLKRQVTKTAHLEVR